jgi:hypothetical protein
MESRQEASPGHDDELTDIFYNRITIMEIITGAATRI